MKRFQVSFSFVNFANLFFLRTINSNDDIEAFLIDLTVYELAGIEIEQVDVFFSRSNIPFYAPASFKFDDVLSLDRDKYVQE